MTIILIIALGSFYGLYSASADNIKNRINENQHKSYKMENLLLDGWQKNEEDYVSTTDAQSVEISKVNCFVNNIHSFPLPFINSILFSYFITLFAIFTIFSL